MEKHEKALEVEVVEWKGQEKSLRSKLGVALEQVAHFEHQQEMNKVQIATLQQAGQVHESEMNKMQQECSDLKLESARRHTMHGNTSDKMKELIVNREAQIDKLQREWEQS